MKRLLLAGMLVASSHLAWADEKPAQKREFRLVSGTVSEFSSAGKTDESTMFKFDPQTGETWILQAVSLGVTYKYVWERVENKQ